VDRISFTRQYDYPKLGEIIPDGTLEILGKKTPISIKGHLGKKMTFLTFWATWCPPCRAEIPVLQDVYRKYKNKGVQVLAVNVDSKDDRDGVKEFSDDLKLEFPIPLDPESAFSSYFGFESIPFMLVLDGKGTILEAHSGKGPNTEKELDAIAEKYTAEKN
jgi:thiol-disulfide isomerase/thioredoxin